MQSPSNAPSTIQTSSVTVTFTGRDATSGVARNEYKLNGGTSWITGNSVTLSTEGVHNLEFRSVDNAGNVGDSELASVTIDLNAPVVSITGPATTSTDTTNVMVSASDSGSGVSGVTVNGETATLQEDGSYSASIDTPCGNTSVTAFATDRAGRTASANATISRTCTVVQPPAAPVVWTSEGFFAPVDMNTPSRKYLNGTKGGSTVSLKFRVFKDGVEQKETSAVSSLNVSKLTCDSGAITDTVEQVASGSTSLRYDGTQFVQNWKTPTTLGCYKAIVTLADGTTTLSADFRITK